MSQAPEVFPRQKDAFFLRGAEGRCGERLAQPPFFSRVQQHFQIGWVQLAGEQDDVVYVMNARCIDCGQQYDEDESDPEYSRDQHGNGHDRHSRDLAYLLFSSPRTIAKSPRRRLTSWFNSSCVGLWPSEAAFGGSRYAAADSQIPNANRYDTAGSIPLTRANLVPKTERTPAARAVTPEDRPKPATIRYSWIRHGTCKSFASTKKAMEIVRITYWAISIPEMMAA